MRYLVIFLFLFSFLQAEVVTSSHTKSTEGEGYGATYEEALDRALADAIARMYGGNLSQNSLFQTQSVKNKNGKDLQKIYNDNIRKKDKWTI